MEIKKTKEATFTQDQVRDLVADVLTDLVIELKDSSLVIASILAMHILEKKLK